MQSLNKMIGATPSQVRSQRVKTFSTNAESQSRIFIEQLKTEIREMEARLEQIADIGPSSATDLNSRLSQIDAKELVRDILTTQFDVELKKMKLESFVRTHNTLFPTAKMDINIYNSVEDEDEETKV